MKLYADLPGRRARQILADCLVVLWVVLWSWFGMAVHDGTMALAAPGRQVAESATGLAGSMSDAGDRLSSVPLVGDEVAAPFDQASSASEQIAEAGREQVDAVESLALVLGLSTALVPILIVVGIWLPRRLRFAREAAAGQRFVDSDADLALFALRAMAHQPMHVLGRISDDPVTAWREGDADVVRALASLEMRTVGLVPPALPAPPA